MATNLLRLVDVGAPAAASTTAVHAAFAGNDASNTFPGPITSPVVPRNLTVTFAAAWDGGSVTVVGTDMADAVINEVFAPGAGTTVTGSKVFKTVTSATKGAQGAAADAASIGTGTKLGIGLNFVGTRGLLFCDGVAEAGTWDATYDSVSPTTAPNGSRVYLIGVSVSVDAGDDTTQNTNISALQTQTTVVVGVLDTPEAAVTANPGVVYVSNQKSVWIKVKGTGDTGWKLMG